MRDRDMDLILIGMLLIWNEARQARTAAAMDLAITTADPTSAASLKKRAIDHLLDLPFKLIEP